MDQDGREELKPLFCKHMCRVVFVLMALWFAGLTINPPAIAAPPWVKASSSSLFQVYWGDNLFIGVGPKGTIMTSPDGITWTAQTSGTTANLNGVVWGNGLYAAVGDNGTILTSTNGSIWTPQTSGSGSNLSSIAFGEGQFVALGANGTELLSANGTSWNARSAVTYSVDGASTTSLPAGKIVWANGPFRVNDLSKFGGLGMVIVNGWFMDAYNGQNLYSLSSESQTWYEHYGNPYNGSASFSPDGIAYGQGHFVLVGNGGTIFTTADLTDRAYYINTSPGITQDLKDVTWVNGQFMAVGNSGTVLISSDGYSWAPQTASISTNLYSVTGSPSTYVVAGSDGVYVYQRPISTDANLSSLSLSMGTLSPGFSKDTTSYTVTDVSNSTTSITVTPSVEDLTAKVTVNGTVVQSGQSSDPISMVVGQNLIQVVVTAQDGSTAKTYQIVVTRNGWLPLGQLGFTSDPLLESNQTNATHLFVDHGTPYVSFITNSGYIQVMKFYGGNWIYVGSGFAAATSRTDVDSLSLYVDNGTPYVSYRFMQPAGSYQYVPGVIKFDGQNWVSVGNIPSTSGSVANVTGVAVDQGTPYIVYMYPTQNTLIIAKYENGQWINVGNQIHPSTPYYGTSFSLRINNGIPYVTYIDADLPVIMKFDSTVNNWVDINSSSIAAGYTSLVATDVENGTPYIAFLDGNGVHVDKFDGTKWISVGAGTAYGSSVYQLNLFVKNGVPYLGIAINNNQDLFVMRYDGDNWVRVGGNLSQYPGSSGNMLSLFVDGKTLFGEVKDNRSYCWNGTSYVSCGKATVLSYTLSSDASLKALNMQDQSGQTIDPGTPTLGNPATVTGADGIQRIATHASYNISVPFNVSQISYVPVLNQTDAKVKVSGSVIPFGQAGPPITLHYGDNTFTIEVTAEDSVTQTIYTVTITRVPDANLSGLAVKDTAGNSVALNANFSANTTAYSATVGNATSNVTVTPTVEDSNGTVTMSVYDSNNKKVLDTVSLTNKQPSGLIPLSVGNNTIDVVVTGGDKKLTKTYSVTLNRLPSSDANLSGLAVTYGAGSQAAFNPMFVKDQTVYSATLPNSAAAVTLTPTKDESNATVTMSVYDPSGAQVWNAVRLSNDQASVPFPLAVGTNLIHLDVTAQDAVTKKTYTLTLTRLPSSDASLSRFTLKDQVGSDVVLSQVNPVNTVTGSVYYSAIVANSITAVTVTPTLDEPNATVTMSVYSPSGANVLAAAHLSSVQASVPIPLAVGVTQVQLNVTAQDTVTKTVYALTVTRQPSSNASLRELSLKDGSGAATSYAPSFSGSITVYTATVASSVTAVTVTPATAEPNATVKVNGTIVASGQASAPVNLSIGPNTITVEVTAQDGTTKNTYTLTVTRNQAPSVPVSTSSSDSTETMPGTTRSVGTDQGTTVVSTDGKLTVPAGGSGQTKLGDELSIIIPPGATDKELRITSEKVLDTSKLAANSGTLVSSVFEILKNFSDNFTKAVTLIFKIDRSKLTNNETPAVFYYDEQNKSWVLIGGKAAGDEITVEVNHFTKFAVFGVAKDGAAVSTAMLSDIKGHWAEEAIQQAVRKGIVSGYPDDTFRPDAPVTRAEFTVLLARALNLTGGGAALSFRDKDAIGEWVQAAVAQAVQAGLIHGYEDNSFRPDARISRAEMAQMLAAAAKQSPGSKYTGVAATAFVDDVDIPAWAKDSVAAMAKLGVLQGRDGNRFAPGEKLTRAEAVTVLLNLLNAMQTDRSKIQ